MKDNIIILLLILELIFKYIFCNESILSKFHQHGYKLRDVRVHSNSFNNKYVNNFQIKTFKHNRTTPAFNATVNMKVAVEDKMEVLVQVYKFLSNEYRHFPIRFQVNVKKAFDANVAGLKAVQDCGNLTTCAFEKDVTYYTCNFVVDDIYLPPLIPTGRYKIDLKYLLFDEEIAFVSAFCEIYTPTAYPKKN